MKSNYQIRKNISEGKYYKLDSNLYSDKKYVNQLEIIAKKYPNAIFTMDSTFYYYELTDVVKNWMRNKETISFLGVWEKLNNKKFKLVEFD